MIRTLASLHETLRCRHAQRRAQLGTPMGCADDGPAEFRRTVPHAS